MPKTKPAPKATHAHIPLRVPADLKTEIDVTAAEVSLSQQETMRQALKRGLPILKQLLRMPSAA